MVERPPRPWLTRLVRAVARVALKVYFRRVQPFHVERVPAAGALLLVSNHPGSLVDALVIGTTVPRPVHFVASVKLFSSPPVAWLLRRCGVVPVNRRQDDPAMMRTVATTFAACHRVFESGGAIGIFPEGITYDDERLKALKTGAARLAIGFADAHRGASGLSIVPVGLTYSAKDRYRSDVLVNFGPAIVADDFATPPDGESRERVRALIAEIERRLRGLIVDLPTLEHDRLVAAVSRLYLERLRAGNLIINEPVPHAAETLLLTQVIGAAVTHFEQHHPDRLQGFVDRLDQYERRVEVFGLSDARLSQLSADGDRSGTAGKTTLLVLAGPVALYGWLHRVVPAAIIGWAVAHLTQDTPRAQTALTAMLSGAVAFGGCYAVYGWLASQWLSWPYVAIYLLTLPPAGVFSHGYQLALRERGLGLRTSRLLLRAPLVKRDLVRRRAALIREIEDFRRDYLEVIRPVGGGEA